MHLNCPGFGFHFRCFLFYFVEFILVSCCVFPLPVFVSFLLCFLCTPVFRLLISPCVFMPVFFPYPTSVLRSLFLRSCFVLGVLYVFVPHALLGLYFIWFMFCISLILVFYFLLPAPPLLESGSYTGVNALSMPKVKSDL